MSDFINKISGSLDKNACNYFFFLTIFFFIILVVSFIAEIFILLRNFKHVTFSNIFHGIFMLFNIFVAYFVNRLLYTMCTKSLD